MGINDRIVGYREHVRLPGLGVGLVAKVDTGARSSSLHADLVRIRSTEDGAMVHAQIPLGRDGAERVVLDAPLVAWRWVRDSGGHGSLRPVVRLAVVLGPWAWQEEVTLADRPGMRHRMLLGRVAVRGRFLVDPDRSFLLGQPGPSVLSPPDLPLSAVPVPVLEPGPPSVPAADASSLGVSA